MGRGQKLCRVEILISAASTASRMPGRRLMRMPWLSSAYSNPRSRISRSMTRPSVWRWEFQHDDNEYIKEGPGAVAAPHPATMIPSELQVGVARAQHGREPGGLHLAAAAFAGLLKMPVIAHFLQGAFAVDLFLQSPQRLVH